MLYKLVKRDFLWWLPVYGPLGVFVAFLGRTFEKILVEFTALVQLRHPNDMGGAYWMFTVVLGLTPVSCFYFASRYLNSSEVSEGDADADTDVDADGGQNAKLTADDVYGVIGGLCALQFLTFLAFFTSIKRKYWGTFFTFKTAIQRKQEFFLNHTEDRHKFLIIGGNRNKLKSIEPQVKEWLNERLPVWLEKQPDWFNATAKAKIPDDMITSPALLNEIRGEEVLAVLSARRDSVIPSLDVGSGRDSRLNAPDPSDPVMRRRKSLVQEARESLRDV